MSRQSDFEAVQDETNFDPSGLKDKGIRTREQASAAEARNIAKVVLKYLVVRPTSRSARFNYEWFIKLHEEMFCDVWERAGAIRKKDINLGVKFFTIREHLHNLVEDFAAWQQSKTPLLTQAAMLHHKAVLIHPFPNGNGRWSRMLANIWLKQNRHPLILWPETDIIGAASTIRAEYIATIRQADGGNYEPLEQLQSRFLQS